MPRARAAWRTRWPRPASRRRSWRRRFAHAGPQSWSRCPARVRSAWSAVPCASRPTTSASRSVKPAGRARRGAMLTGRLEHCGDAVGVQPPGACLLAEQVGAPARRGNASRCGRGSVIAWYASAAASRRARGREGRRCHAAVVTGAVEPLVVEGCDRRECCARKGERLRTRSVWYACSLNLLPLVRRQRRRPSARRVPRQPTRPTSCTNAARRIAATSAAAKPHRCAAAPASCATPAE